MGMKNVFPGLFQKSAWLAGFSAPESQKHAAKKAWNLSGGRLYVMLKSLLPSCTNDRIAKMLVCHFLASWISKVSLLLKTLQNVS